MNIEKCVNCNEALTDIELEAKHEDKADSWVCYECYDDEDGLSSHGKYIKLLNFVKDNARPSHNSFQNQLAIHCKALLKEIGEFKEDLQ